MKNSNDVSVFKYCVYEVDGDDSKLVNVIDDTLTSRGEILVANLTHGAMFPTSFGRQYQMDPDKLTKWLDINY